MSLTGKVWKIKNEDARAPLWEKLLANRGLSPQTAEGFLNPTAAEHFHDPFLMKDMAKAVTRISAAIENKERIMIFGDYDVDGITGSAILVRALKFFQANVSCRLPHRIQDGYGLRKKFIDEFAALDVKLVITVDNGISCFEEVSYAGEKRIDVIISDHHTVPMRIPPAYAILHPKLPDCGYPFMELTGAGVALKLAQALLASRTGDGAGFVESLLDLAAMGTVADLGEMTGENRYIVREGLRVLQETRWPGLSRLKESAGIKGKIDTHDIGFMLCPRINAAGRISHAEHALRLLINDSAQTIILAETLERLNRERQAMMGELLEIALQKAIAHQSAAAIVLYDTRFHAGVIGLLAAKLVDAYHRPAIVMEDRGDVLVGSCRSIPAVNIVKALTEIKTLLVNFGGHAAAAGFEIKKENVEEFVIVLQAACERQFSGARAEATLTIECRAQEGDLTLETAAQIARLEPFGVGNEKPRILVSGLPVHAVNAVGKERKHLKIISSAKGASLDCIAFQFGDFLQSLAAARKMDVVAELEENEWNGRKSLQLKIVDCRVMQ